MFRSTLTFSNQTPLTKDDLKKCQELLQKLHENQDSFEFRQPVDHKKLGLTDYPQIITYQMDLGTAKKKLQGNKYALIEEFLDDLQMIWQNCKTYNAEGSWIFNLADKLERYFKKLIKNYLPQIQLNPPKDGAQQQQAQQTQPQAAQQTAQQAVQQQPQQPAEQVYEEPEGLTFTQKNQFSQKMRHITQEQLGIVVQIIQSSCPTAFRDVDKDKCQILVDQLTVETFNVLTEKIDLWCAENPQKKVKV